VRVDGGVARRARQVLVLAVRYVLVRSGVAVFLGEAEVDDVDQVALLAEAHKEVVGLHVSVDEVLRVYVFDAADLEGRGHQRDAFGIRATRRTRGDPELTIWSASSRTVLRLNFREQKLNRSSRLGPSSSITITL